MEKKVQIKTADNYIIYGTLNALPENNDALIIFVHGLSGNQNEHHYFNAVPFFNSAGFNVFRFDFYSRADDSRPLSESSITTHVTDLQLVFDHFRGQYKKFIVIGHSLGCLVILRADLSAVAKIVFWDPTTGFDNISDKKAEFNPNLDRYILHWGKDILVGKQLIEEWKSIDLNLMVKNVTVPCKFIFAGVYNKHLLWKPYLKKIKVEFASVIIEGASHGFVEVGTEKKLFEETLDWIKLGA
ncbi:MAG: alpha/beta hydrolase [Candidatus Komeilibacteria bacterium]|nr:alpha/beta hydrolase [Candidatus Komeilibacteria bacterium]